MRAQKPDPPVSSRPAARAGDTQFTHNKDCARRVARARRARAQKPDPPVSWRRAARAGITQFADNKEFARRDGRAARAQKPHPQYPPAKTRFARLRSARTGKRGFFNSKDVACRAARARKNRIRSSQGARRRTRAIPGPPITRMSHAARAQAQKTDLPVSRRQAARAGNTRFAHNNDVARRARAKIRSASRKAAGSARGQYPVRP